MRPLSPLALLTGLGALLFAGLGVPPEARAQQCTTQPRGAGTMPTSCGNAGAIFRDGNCYDPCKTGYFGEDPPAACYQRCPAEFTQDGRFCAKPAAYGRGAGYIITDKAKCERENPGGCEQDGLLFYPKCREGFHPAGCCICSPNCPSGMTDIGVSCVADEQIRKPRRANCPAGVEKDAGLCYPKCAAGFVGVGPVCWSSGCSPTRLIVVKDGVTGDRKYLSATADGTKVDLFTRDDGSGRQRWSLVADPKGEDWHNIVVAGGVSGGRKYLSTTADGTKLDLYDRDDGSGRQRWFVGTFIDQGYTLISIWTGVNGYRKYLSTNGDGTVIDLFDRDDGSGRQRWVLSIP